MVASVRNMWVASAATLCLLAVVSAAGNGYNYEPPSVPFPPIPAPNKQPAPAPYRPPQPRPNPPARPTYIPPQQPEHHEHHEEHHHHEDHHHHEPGMPFDFAYQVNEDGNDFSHNAISDGDVTRGEYRVALPDGRTQIVKYTADWKNGFNAEVTYEGEAQYPEPPVGGYQARPQAQGGQAYLPPSQGGGYQY